MCLFPINYHEIQTDFVPYKIKLIIIIILLIRNLLESLGNPEPIETTNVFPEIFNIA